MACFFKEQASVRVLSESMPALPVVSILIYSLILGDLKEQRSDSWSSWECVCVYVCVCVLWEWQTVFCCLQIHMLKGRFLWSGTVFAFHSIFNKHIVSHRLLLRDHMIWMVKNNILWNGAYLWIGLHKLEVESLIFVWQSSWTLMLCFIAYII